jgi:hypothetical protein
MTHGLFRFGVAPRETEHAARFGVAPRETEHDQRIGAKAASQNRLNLDFRRRFLRISPALFLCRQRFSHSKTNNGRRGLMTTALVSCLTSPNGYSDSGWSAAEHWDLTEQIFRSIMVMTTRKPRNRRPGNKRTAFVFRSISPDAFFGTKPIRRSNRRGYSRAAPA